MKKLLQFKAKWCGPCKLLEPLIKEYSGKYEVVTIDVDDLPDLVLEKKIGRIPTILIIDGESEVARLSGQEITKKVLDSYV